MSKRRDNRQTRTEDEKLNVRGEERIGERVPLSESKARLSAPKIPGYETRIINDEGDRIYHAQRGGWEFVTDDEIHMSGKTLGGDGNKVSSKVSYYVGIGKDLKPITAYLMKIKKEWYDEDQRAKVKARNDDRASRLEAMKATGLRGRITKKSIAGRDHEKDAAYQAE